MPNNLAQILPLFKGLVFRAGTLRLRLEQINTNDVVTVVIDDAIGTGIHGASIRMHLIPSDETLGQRSTGNAAALPTLMLYPGRRRHPLGRQAPTSWLNEMGDGLVALATDGMLINVMVEGIITSSVHPVAERTRGRPNGSLLWMAAVALSLPINLNRRLLIESTHFSGFTTDQWLNLATKNGWMTASTSERFRRYTATVSGINALAEFVEAKWQEWRLGRYPDRLGSPMLRYFVARASLDHYREVANEARQPFIATGITILEQRANLVPSGSIREMAFITTKESLSAMAAETNLDMMEKREVPGASEVTILSRGHPIFGLFELRKASARDAWPLGLAALDAFEHPNPRVAMLAKDQWRKWLIEIQTINTLTYGDGDRRSDENGDSR